ncbi:MAG: hypothetical protein GC191_20390 [Azospirillum sp.]|nr:hypothetical protein [Azospirillum sp.]
MTFSAGIRQYFVNKSGEAVFVIGCARSGTTLLFNYINEFDDCVMLCEDLPFFHDRGANYRSWYNSHWRSLGHSKTKGYYLPSFGHADGYWFDYYRLLKERYRIIGSKQAFGPHGEEYWAQIDRYCVDFFLNYFPNAHYILPMRRPDENLWSMSQMFGAENFGSLKNTWLKSVITQVHIFATAKNAQFLFMDDVDLPRIARIASVVGEPSSLSEGYLRSRSAPPSDWPPLDEHSFEIDQLLAAYAFIRRDFDGETGRTHPWVHKQLFCDTASRELEGLRGDSKAAWPLT